MKTISVYVQGGMRSAVFRYRYYQYFEQMSSDRIVWHKWMSDKLYDKYMPLAKQGLLVKLWMFVYMLCRLFGFLLHDTIHRPNNIVISRAFSKKRIPLIYKWMLRSLHSRGSHIIWDFDDDIIENNEISPSDFSFMAHLADVIVVATPYLKDIIPTDCQHKMVVITTTDGCMVQHYCLEVTSRRLASFTKVVRLLWVGSFSNLEHLKPICNQLEKVASDVQSIGKELDLRVVCDQPLDYQPKHYTLHNILWSAEVAEKEFLEAHVGLMPLLNNRIARGKGGFKLIQYLSVGLPSVSSPVGINAHILENEVGGILVDRMEDSCWSDAIARLIKDEATWLSYSEKAYNNYLANYNYEANFEQWVKILK